MTKNNLKVVHIPFSGRNPYQKLLSDHLVNEGLDVQGVNVDHVLNISFLNLSIITLILRYWKPDIIHLHWQSSFLNVDGSRFKTLVKSLIFIIQIWTIKKIGIKLIWTAHNLKRHERAYRDIEARYTNKLAKMSDRIIVHCDTAKGEILQRFDDVDEIKIAVIPHGNFSDYYSNQITRAAARQKLGIAPSKFTYLFLGEVRYYKGVIELIETFKLMRSDEVQLIIAGRPHNKNIFQNIIHKTESRNNIRTHLAYIPDDELQVYIKASDVMVFPYRHIFTSGGIYLALSFGKPILAPHLGCIHDVLKHTDNFTYFASESRGLLQAMQLALASKPRLEAIGKSNLQLAHQFSWEKIAQSTHSLYRNSINY